MNGLFILCLQSCPKFGAAGLEETPFSAHPWNAQPFMSSRKGSFINWKLDSPSSSTDQPRGAINTAAKWNLPKLLIAYETVRELGGGSTTRL